MPPTKKFYTSSEVAQLLSVTKPTLLAWVARGRIPAPIRIGGDTGKRMWDASEIDKFLEGLKASSGVPNIG